MNSSVLLIYVVVIGGVFVFMTSRGNRKRRAQQSELQSALVHGALVRTIGGLIGEVVEVTDEHVIVETTPGVKLKFIKSAVAGVIAPDEPAAAEAESAESDAAGPAEPADDTQKGRLAAESAPQTVQG